MPIFGDQPGGLLQSILEDVGVAIAVHDAAGKLVYANHTALAIFGMSGLPQKGEWGGKYRVQDSLGHDIPVERSPAMRALAGEKVEPQDLRVTLPDGRSKWVHASTHPFSVLGLTG